jgi:hypothetical protein
MSGSCADGACAALLQAREPGGVGFARGTAPLLLHVRALGGVAQALDAGELPVAFDAAATRGIDLPLQLQGVRLGLRELRIESSEVAEDVRAQGRGTLQAVGRRDLLFAVVQGALLHLPRRAALLVLQQRKRQARSLQLAIELGLQGPQRPAEGTPVRQVPKQ